MRKQDRKKLILEIIEKAEKLNISQLLKELEGKTEKLPAQITINRDLRELVEEKLIEKSGQGPAVYYTLPAEYELIRDIDREDYFRRDIDNRSVRVNFNFEIFDLFKDFYIFNSDELSVLDELAKKYKKKIKNIPADIAKKEFERLAIDLSWKSSRIEGNTYDLLETENLIKENKEAAGHSRAEAVMILNHKKTLDYINAHKEKFREISISKIEDVHYLLTKDMDISRNLRTRMVGITGTNYRPPDNEHQIKEAMERICALVNGKKNVFAKAVLLNLLIAYVQPFVDGNKRTSRFMGNAALMAGGLSPLSFRSIDEVEYKKAIILFYEQNNIKYFKELFMDQFKFAVDNYFLA